MLSYHMKVSTSNTNCTQCSYATGLGVSIFMSTIMYMGHLEYAISTSLLTVVMIPHEDFYKVWNFEYENETQIRK